MNEAAKKAGRISAKDLINIGVFTVLYAVLVIAVSMLGFIPIFVPLMSVLCPVVGGIPFMLFLTRVKKFGMVTIMGLLMGCVMLIGGMGVFGPVFGLVFGFLADLVLRSGGYASAAKSVLANALFSIQVVGNYVPIYLNKEGYAANIIAGGYGEEYAQALITLFPNWLLPVLVVSCFVFGLLGGLLGRALLKKHFVRAGIA